MALLAVLIVLIPTIDSYGHALTGPGNDSLNIRSVEWLRSHHFRWAVNDVENWWYTHHQPKKGGVLSAAQQAEIAGGGAYRKPLPKPAATINVLPSPAPIPPLVADPSAGEGQWRPLGRLVDGVPAMYVTYLRPDAVHTTLLTGVAWIDPKLVKAVQYAGAVEPGGTGWAHQLPIAPSVRPQLLAAFNSGFKMKDAQGGYYDSGRYAGTMRAGAATLWITADGTLNVGEWGRDVSITTPGLVQARQNLDLIVDGGQPAPGVQYNDPSRWGFTLGNTVLVWRSGLGVTANGALVYVGGDGLSAYSLARLLVRAGAVRAMELDINSSWVDFFTYSPGPAGSPPGDLSVSKLVYDMSPSTSNYLSASSRDGIALFSR
jgi:Phosphodiester glycosidase